ncbi:hypothetical protein FO519_008994 [Halicephalobus sp. NKZ332]|nr:hypothetical protein FO519_008994 [Halicephalobus sp. NKZ332]
MSKFYGLETSQLNAWAKEIIEDKDSYFNAYPKNSEDFSQGESRKCTIKTILHSIESTMNKYEALDQRWITFLETSKSTEDEENYVRTAYGEKRNGGYKKMIITLIQTQGDLRVELDRIKENLEPKKPTAEDQQKTNTIKNYNGPQAVRMIKDKKNSHRIFSGDPLNYNAFIDSFQAEIGSNPDLSDVEKLMTLKDRLQGEATAVVEDYRTAEGYPLALKTLERHFGDPEIIADKVINQLIEPCNDRTNTTEVRKAFRRYQYLSARLIETGESVEVAFFRWALKRRLSDNILRHLANTKSAKKEGEKLTLKNMTEIAEEFLIGEVWIQAENKTPSKHSTDKKVVAAIKKDGKNKSDSKSPAKRIPKCPFCENPHYANECPRCPSIEEKRKVVMEKKLCYKCLKGGHLATDCKITPRCRKCQGAHQTCWCGSKEEAKKGVIASVIKKKTQQEKTCLHMTARAYIFNPEDTRIKQEVLFMIDSGAAYNMIDVKVAEKLKLRPRKEQTQFTTASGMSILSEVKYNFCIELQDGDLIELEAAGSKKVLPKMPVPIIPESIYNNMEYFSTNPVHITCEDPVILLDMHVYADHVRDKKCDNLANGFRLYHSDFGPILWATGNTTDKESIGIYTTIKNPEKQNEEINKLWNLDVLGITEDPNADEKRLFRERFQETVHQDGSGKIFVDLPFVDESELGKNFYHCYHRLLGLARRDKTHLELFQRCFQEYLKNGFIEIIPNEELDLDKGHYMPYSMVIKEGKTTKKDLTKDNIVVYQFRVVPFGLNSSPNLLKHSIDYHLENRAAEDPNLKNLVRNIKKNCYVDNLVLASNSVEEAIKDNELATKLFKEGGMNLRGHVSTNKEVNNYYGIEDKTANLLGHSLDLENDILIMGWSKGKVENIPNTKRKLLSFTASLYDITGLLEPIKLPLKLQITTLYNEREGIQFQIPRLLFERQKNDRYELHVFGDSSSVAMGVAAYIRTTNRNATRCALIYGKSRLTPLKPVMTISKLELTATALAQFAANTVKEEMKEVIEFQKTYIWTDSTTVLHWIKDPEMKGRFIINRVRKLQSSNSEFRYVDTFRNPADVASRGCTPAELKENYNWWNGPEFLQKGEECWPTFPDNLNQKENAPLIAALTLGTASAIEHKEGLFPAENFKSWISLTKCVVAVLKFLGMKSPEWKNRNCKTEDETELNQIAEKILIQQIQGSQDVSQLKANEMDLYQLNGIWRKRTRISHQQDPIYLSKCHATTLLILDIHKRMNHASANGVLAELNQRFFLPRARVLIKKAIRRHCMFCRIRNAVPFSLPLMPKLPSTRSEGEPFNTRIKWRFITERAPWKGGFYEALIKLVKRNLKTAIGKRKVTLSKFITWTTQVEAWVNCRPLTYIDNSGEYTIVRPISLITPYIKPGLPDIDNTIDDPDFVPNGDNHGNLVQIWKKNQVLITKFRNQFNKEYLMKLRDQASRFHKNQGRSIPREPKIGEIVLLEEENLDKMDWRLGRILDIERSPDGKCRAAQLKVGNGRTLRRPLNLLYPIEIDPGTILQGQEPVQDETLKRLEIMAESESPLPENGIIQSTTKEKETPETHTMETRSKTKRDIPYTPGKADTAGPKGNAHAIYTLEPTTSQIKALSVGSPVNAQIGHHIAELLREEKPQYCSLEPDDRCDPIPEKRHFMQVELLDGTKHLVKHLQINLRQSNSFRCFGEGETDGPPVFCEQDNHSCSRQGKMNCVPTLTEIALWTGSLGTIKIRAWGLVEKTVYGKRTFVITDPETQCKEGKLTITAVQKNDIVQIDLPKTTLYDSSTNTERNILIPRETRMINQKARIIIWRKGLKVFETETECPKQDFCEIIECHFCPELLSNFECRTIGTTIMFIITITGIVLLIIEIMYLCLRKKRGERAYWLKRIIGNRLNKYQNMELAKKFDDMEAASLQKDWQSSLNTRYRSVFAITKETALATLTLLTVIGQAQSCSQVVSFRADEKLCMMTTNLVKNCQYNEVARFSIEDTNEICIQFADDEGRPQTSWKLSVQPKAVCKRGYTRYSRIADIQVLSAKRCPASGSCTGDICQNIKPNDFLQELTTVAKFPGVTKCVNSCGCWGCGCLICTDACTFYRYYATPVTPEIIEEVECEEWVIQADIKVDQILGTKRTVKEFTASPLQVVKMGQFAITVTSTVTDKNLAIRSKLLHDGHRVAFSDSITSAAMEIIQCSSKERAAKFDCQLKEDSCQCPPTGESVNCLCKTNQIIKSHLDHSSLPHVEFPIKLNDGAFEMKLDQARTDIQIEAAHMEVVTQVDGNQCYFDSASVFGCRNCKDGARISLRCHTDFGKALAHINCSIIQFSILCDDSNHTIAVTLQDNIVPREMKTLILFVLGSLIVTTAGFGRVQSAAVRGVLMCNENPAVNVTVRFYDEDRAGFDDLMNEGVTDSQGRFELSGYEHELTEIDPVLKIYHDCNNDDDSQLRRLAIVIPDNFISEGKTAERTFNIGTLNLAGIFKKDSYANLK